MKIKQILITPYEITYVFGYRRLGALVKLVSEEGMSGEGDLAPLPERNKESLRQALEQLTEHQS